MIWATLDGIDVDWHVLVVLNYNEPVTESDGRVSADGPGHDKLGLNQLGTDGLGYDWLCTDGIELD